MWSTKMRGTVKTIDLSLITLLNRKRWRLIVLSLSFLSTRYTHTDDAIRALCML